MGAKANVTDIQDLTEHMKRSTSKSFGKCTVQKCFLNCSPQTIFINRLLATLTIPQCSCKMHKHKTPCLCVAVVAHPENRGSPSGAQRDILMFSHMGNTFMIQHVDTKLQKIQKSIQSFLPKYFKLFNSPSRSLSQPRLMKAGPTLPKTNNATAVAHTTFLPMSKRTHGNLKIDISHCVFSHEHKDWKTEIMSTCFKCTKVGLTTNSHQNTLWSFIEQRQRMKIELLI